MLYIYIHENYEFFVYQSMRHVIKYIYTNYRQKNSQFSFNKQQKNYAFYLQLLLKDKILPDKVQHLLRLCFFFIFLLLWWFFYRYFFTLTNRILYNVIPNGTMEIVWGEKERTRKWLHGQRLSPYTSEEFLLDL